MKNSYLIAGLVVLVAILGLILSSKKTEAPLENTLEKESDVPVLAGPITDGTYKLDTEASILYWEGEYLTGLSEKGTVNLKSGEITVAQGLISGGEFVIDMNTIDSNPRKDRLVTHLKSDDFFGVENHPTATFTLKSMAATSEIGAKEGRYVIAGDLTVRGITKPISFTANLKPEGDTLSGTASFAINRADWEIKYNSPTFFKDLGDKIIRDAVTIGLDLKAERVIQ